MGHPVVVALLWPLALCLLSGIAQNPETTVTRPVLFSKIANFENYNFCNTMDSGLVPDDLVQPGLQRLVTDRLPILKTMKKNELKKRKKRTKKEKEKEKEKEKKGQKRKKKKKKKRKKKLRRKKKQGKKEEKRKKFGKKNKKKKKKRKKKKKMKKKGKK